MRTWLLGWAIVAAAAGPVSGQTAPREAAARPGEVESDPIRCWWRADRTAVRVGERFGVLLTCAVIETGPITVVAALNQLEPGALSLTPFEVVSGARADDIVAPPWRYVQFDYQVRLLSDGFFGQDLMVPALTVTYNLQTARGTQGRDQTYVLPALPMRIVSLVPRGAADIRDASGQTFADIGSRRFRSSLAQILGWMALACAAVLAVFALLRVRGAVQARRAVGAPALDAASVLGACQRTLAEVASEASRDGWSPSLARRAGAALRLAAAVALERPVAQRVVPAAAAAREGQVAARTGWLRPRRVHLSASTTGKAIAGRLTGDQPLGAAARVRLESMAGALGALNAASYGRPRATDEASLSAAVESGREVIRGLRLRQRWPLRTAAAVARSFTGV